MTNQLPMTAKTRVRRIPKRASYDRDAVYATIDNALFATIAFSDGKQVHAIPSAIWREHDHVYIHGSNGSRLLKLLSAGASVCVSTTQIDGLVLARSALNHSMNYQSVCIYGVFTAVAANKKNAHLRYFLEHWLPGRWQYVRPPNKKELAATTILRMPILEAVLKRRHGEPSLDDVDVDYPVWAGVIPLLHQWQSPQQALEQAGKDWPGTAVREYVSPH